MLISNNLLVIIAILIAVCLEIFWILWRKGQFTKRIPNQKTSFLPDINSASKSFLNFIKKNDAPRIRPTPVSKPIIKLSFPDISADKVIGIIRKLANNAIIWWKNNRHQIFASRNNAIPIAPDLKHWQAIIEIAVIVVLVWSYCWGFLDLGQHTILPGNESELFPTLDTIFSNTLHQTGHFLTWNPYLFSGLPLIGDPMFHLFNPLVSAPILLFGVGAADGFKIAVFLSFIVGAVGMWFLALTFGMKRVTRIWMALLFAFAGTPTARFFSGEYLFIFAWAFIPWVIGGFYAVYRTRRRIYAAITAFALAEMFLSGNAYYAFLMIFIIVVFLFVFLFTLARKKPILRFEPSAAIIFISIGLVAIGLCAVQILPTSQLWPRIVKAEDMAGSQNPGQVLEDFLSNNSFRPDLYPTYPAREEFYAYIGYIPFIFLLFLPLALIKRNKRTILFAFSALVVTLLWIDVKDMPWAGLYSSTHIFSQFRHQIRMIIYTEVGLLILMGYSLDTAWQTFSKYIFQKPKSISDHVKRITSFTLKGLLLGLAGYSILIVYTTNRPATTPQPINDQPYQVISWLDQFDQSIFYTRYNPNNDAFAASISNHMRLLEPWYHFGSIRIDTPSTNQRLVEAHPNYIIQGDQDPPPANSKVIKTISNLSIYRSLDALTFSFSVKNQTLADTNDGELKQKDTIPQTTYSPYGDLFEVIASGSSDSTLVTLITNFPGWVVRIDGQPALLQPINGYLAVAMRNGVHKYTFSFESNAFKIGLIISLLSLLVLAYWMLREMNWIEAWAWLTNLSRPGEFKRREGFKQNPLTSFYHRIVEWQSVNINFGNLNIQIKRTTNPAKWIVSLGTVLFIASLVVYGYIHFTGIKQYPIYFFADEATQTNYAQDLIKNHMMDGSGNFLPIYYEASPNQWTPVFSIYPQAVSLLLFGKSIVTTRGTTIVISFLAVIALSLILKRIFKARYWWTAVLILGLIPAWFLHSRTGFETAMMASFFAVFILFYLLYLTESPKFIFPAILFAGLTFYTYSNAQVIIPAIVILLVISDIRYHLKNWQTNRWALLLGMVMLIPLILFYIQHPSGLSTHLETTGSYWYSGIPFSEKLWTFLQKYSYSLSPQYWFISNGQDLSRHKMGSFGNIWLGMLPFFLIGLVAFLWHFRSAKYRVIVLTMLAIPLSSSLADIGITRVLSFVIPATLLISLGLNWLLEFLSKKALSTWVALITFFALAFASINMLQTTLTNGPFWDKDYGLYGMQWGATQLFEGIIPKYLAMNPNYQVRVSSSWANGSDRFIPFFLSEKDQQRVIMDSLDGYAAAKHDLNMNMIFIAVPNEYEVVKKSDKFEKIIVREIVPYPDGTPGFYILQAAYRSDIDSIFTAEKEARKVLVKEDFNLNGQGMVVRHSTLDAGQINNIFDNDRNTLIRGLEANPFIIEFEFNQPQAIQGITLQTNQMRMHITALLYASSDDQSPKKFEKDFQYGDSPGDSADMNFPGGPYPTQRLRVEILNKDIGPDIPVNIHLREFRWH